MEDENYLYATNVVWDTPDTDKLLSLIQIPDTFSGNASDYLAQYTGIKALEFELRRLHPVTVRKIATIGGYARYVDAFTIPSGEKVIVRNAVRTATSTVGNYYNDECHIYIDNNLYHVDEFADMLDRMNANVTPANAKNAMQKYFTIEVRERNSNSDPVHYCGRGLRLPYPEEATEYVVELAAIFNDDIPDNFVVTDVREIPRKYVNYKLGCKKANKIPLFTD